MINTYKSPRIEAGSSASTSMRKPMGLILVALLTAWTSFVAIRIEVANAAAGYYIPGREGEHGKWRMSRQGDKPRDILREWVETFGLLQYPVASLLAIIAFRHYRAAVDPTSQLVAVVGGVVAVLALLLANYRQYFASLGW